MCLPLHCGYYDSINIEMFLKQKPENAVLYTISQSFILFLHHTCLCELDSNLYCNELVGMKVRNQEGEKVSL